MSTSKHPRSIAWGIGAVLASIGLMNYPLISANSSCPAPGLRLALHAIQKPADGPAPLAITPALDTARAASAIITTDRGTLTATAANGALFALTIPKGGLVDQQSITMTPVASIPDLPFGGGVAGGGAVQLAPEGLILMETATLVIQPASPISFDQQAPFGWVNAGDDFHLFPLTLDLTTITLNIDHLDGYGVGSGSSTDRQTIAAHQPSRLQPRREQNAEIAVDTARNKLAGNLTKKQQKKVIKALNATLSDLFQADLAIIESELTPPKANKEQHPEIFDGASLLCGLTDLLKLVRDQSELGVPLPSDAVTQATFAISTLTTQYFDACEENVLSVGSLISLARITSSLARADSRLAGLASQVPDILDKANNCAKLQLIFNSNISASFQYGTYFVSMHAEVPLKLDAVHNEFDGQAAMTHLNFYVIPKLCSVVTSSIDDTCRVFLKLGNLIATDCDSNTAYPKDYDLYIDIGSPLETVTVVCPFIPSVTTTKEIWVGQFNCSHAADYYSGLFRIQGWTTGEGDVLATKDYVGVPCKENPFDEDTTIEVRRQ